MRAVKKTFLWVSVAVFLIVSFLVLYAMVAFVPFSGDLYVSNATKAAYRVSNFRNDTEDGGHHERVRLLDESADSFWHRINIIREAESEIYMTSLQMRAGVSSTILIGALVEAAERGVLVYLLIDGKNYRLSNEMEWALTSNDNVTLYKYNSASFFNQPSLGPSMHDKLLVIDNKFLIIGGRNVADQYFSYDNYRGKNRFIDTEVLVYNEDTSQDGAVAQAKDYFVNSLSRESCVKELKHSARGSRNFVRGTDFARSAKTRCKGFMDSSARSFDYTDTALMIPTNKINLITNSTAPKKKESVVAYNLYRLALDSSDITIQTPYTVLTKANTDWLADACKNADRVRILTNCAGNTDTIFSFSNYMTNRKSYLRTGAEIYEWQTRGYTIHSKVYLFDGRLTAVGSFNLDEHSTRLDTESMLVIDSTEFNAAVTGSIQKYFDNSLKVDNKTNKYEHSNTVAPLKVSFWNKILMGIVGNLTNIVRYMV